MSSRAGRVEPVGGATPVLSGTDLHLRYDANVALAGADLVVRAGEAVALVGPSGSGKSSLLRCLAGLQRPSSGSVVFEGRELYALREVERSRVRLSRFGFVFQSAELINELSLLENIALPVELNGTRRRAALREAAAWAERLGIDDAAARRPGQVSGGQRQRAAIARAVATKPSVVFADEPTGALDSRNRDLVLDLLLETCVETGSSLVLVTHDVSAAESCGRIVELLDGRARERERERIQGATP